MRIIGLKETSGDERHAIVKDTFKGRLIRDAGAAAFPPGCVAHDNERHVHDHDEVFIILSGEITVPITNGPTGEARAGDWVLVEAGEEHHLTNRTDATCVAIFMILGDKP